MRLDVVALAERFEILEGESSKTVLVVVDRGLYIRGRVLDPQDAPAPKSGVGGMCKEPRSIANAQVDADGRFALGPLIAGKYELRAFLNPTYAASDSVEATAGDEDVVLRLKVGGVIAGRGFDASSGTGCEAELYLVPIEWPGWGAMWKETNSSGEFELKAISPGSYVIVLRTSDGRIGHWERLDVVPGGRIAGVDVPLKPGGRVRLTWKGVSPYRVVRLFDAGLPIALQYPHGEGSEVVIVPAGRLVVRVSDDEHDTKLREGVIEVGVGETRDVDLDALGG